MRNTGEPEKRRQNGWKAAMVVLLCTQLLLVLYYGGKKEGFHEDEYYSYYSTNRTTGLFEPDREWVDRDTFRNEFVVLPGEGFQYGLVALSQSWDVHPPFFYFLLHTACSFFPGVFSKWLGIGVNLAAFLVNFFLLAWLAYMVTDKNKLLTFLVSAVNGFNAVMISGVLFIRMYEWLTLFVLLCACLHVRAIKKGDIRFRSFLLPLMAVNFLGFLTQYYYLIFLFFMAAGFFVYRLFCDRKLKNAFVYAFCCGISILLGVISYPASLSHIFRGYRGTGAVSEFLNAANTGDRIRFFTGLMNEYVFDGFLWLWLLLAAGMAVFLVILQKRKKTEGQAEMEKQEEAETRQTAPYILLLFASCGYFFTVSKTALLLYETSNRYELPIYGIILLLVITALYTLGERLLSCFHCSLRVRTVFLLLLIFVFFFDDVHGLVQGKVLFLYEGEKERTEYARENAKLPVVILYNDTTPYHVWWCSNELMEYDRVYFANENNQEKFTDEVLCSGEKLIVYAADGEAKEKSLQLLLNSNPHLNGSRLVSKKDLWSVYELQ